MNVPQRVRIRFSKHADLRWIGHRDLARLLERLLRRSGVSLRTSQGFHPKPRITFPSALAVGIVGMDEVLELELYDGPTAGELAARLRAQAPAGLVIGAVEILPPGAGKARVRSFRYAVAVDAQLAPDLHQRIARLRAMPSCWIRRPRSRHSIDLAAQLEELSSREGVLHMKLGVGPQGSIGPRDVLAALGLPDLEKDGACLVRSAVELAP